MGSQKNDTRVKFQAVMEVFRGSLNKRIVQVAFLPAI